MLGVRPCEPADDVAVVISRRGSGGGCAASVEEERSGEVGDAGGDGDDEEHVSYWLRPDAIEGGREEDELEKNSEPNSDDVRRSCSDMNARGRAGGNALRKSSGWVVERAVGSLRLGAVSLDKSACRALHVFRFSWLCRAKGSISRYKESVTVG